MLEQSRGPWGTRSLIEGISTEELLNQYGTVLQREIVRLGEAESRGQSFVGISARLSLLMKKGSSPGGELAALLQERGLLLSQYDDFLRSIMPSLAELEDIENEMNRRRLNRHLVHGTKRLRTSYLQRVRKLGSAMRRYDKKS